MSRTLKDIKKEYLSKEEQQKRNHYGVCAGCEWCLPAINRVRSSERRNAIEFELNLIELDEANELLQQAINKFRNN